MQEVKGNIWEYHKNGCQVGITTNGVVKSSGKLTMGKGVALQAVIRMPKVQKIFGDLVSALGNKIHWLQDYRIFSFPVKHHYTYKADLKLIKESCSTLMQLASIYPEETQVLPRPGVGNGKRDWEEIKPILEEYFGQLENIIVVEYEE